MKSKKLLRLNKKGSLWDIPVMAVFLMSFAMSIFLVYIILSKFQVVNATSSPNANSDQIVAKGITTIKLYDYIFIFLMVGLSIATVLLAFQIKTHPALFFVSLTFLLIITVITAALSDVFGAFKAASPIQNNATGVFPMIGYAMDNLPGFYIIIGFLIMIALYAFRPVE